ncbi:MAG: hypothetical protein ACJ73D_01900, partial [Pyrinomonadaceae bacterium]
VTTGSDGKVKATFTAQKKGLAGLDATYYPYTTVTHHESGSHQNATVQIGDPPSGVWQMNIDATETDTDDTVRSTDDDDGHQEVNDHQTIKRTAHVTVWLNSNTETGNIRGSEVIAVSGDGNFDFLSTFHHLSTSPSCSTKGDGRRVAEGTFVPAETVFAFDIYPDHANVNGTIFIKGGGTDDTWGFESCADPPRVHQHQESKDDGYAIELGYGSDQLDAPITPQNKQSRTFKFDLSQHERNQDDKGGVTERTRTGTITLKPLTISQTPPGLRRH